MNKESFNKLIINKKTAKTPNNLSTVNKAISPMSKNSKTSLMTNFNQKKHGYLKVMMMRNKSL